MQIQSKPAKVPLHQWEEPAENWERIHIDYAGPFQDHFFLIVIDAKSRWAEVRIIRDAPTTQTSISLLNDIFATHGYPSIMVSDNATVFTSDNFKTYCSKNGIFQKLIAPGHPSTNGLAEHNVQTIKRKLKAMADEPGSLHNKLNEILQRYRATPLICGKSPAELYFNRRIRIRLDALKPTYKGKSAKPKPGVRQLSVGERVQAVHTRSNKTVWKTGVILQRYGHLHYLVKLDDGYTLKRHIDQLKTSRVQSRKVQFVPDVENKSSQVDKKDDQYYLMSSIFHNHNNNQQEAQVQDIQQPPQNTGESQGPQCDQQLPSNQQPGIRRSERIRNKPAYLRDYIEE